MKIRAEIHSSITSIARAEWDRFFGHEAEGYDFYVTLERSRLPGFEFAYVSVFVDGEVELLAPLFWADLDLAIGWEGLPARLLAAWRRIDRRCLIVRTLFVGSPFGEHATIGVAAGATEPGRLLEELVAAARGLCRKHGLSFLLFKDLRAADAAALRQPLERLGFTQGESFPNVYVPLPYASMDEYLAALSYGTRKDLRRKLRAGRAAAISVEVVEDVTDRIDAVYALYLNTYHAGTVRFEKLTREYFLEVGRHERGKVKFFLYHAGGRLVCFNLCFLHDGVLVDKFIGLDYDVARALNLYFYTWHSNIEWCIRHGVRAYQVGQTDYEAKLRLGGRAVPLLFFARHRNPIVNLLLRAAAPLLAPKAGGADEALRGNSADETKTQPKPASVSSR